MGPWLCSHGKPFLLAFISLSVIASMGPWLCSHGKWEPVVGYPWQRPRFNGAVAV